MHAPLPAVGDEVALFSAARHSSIPAPSAVVPPRRFGSGCAALRKPCRPMTSN